ncbi:hypothetical protein P4V48_11735, partial [Bacillus thuringiensis]|nr:hypothetical protein [Bacillus thuringiensis]MED2148006.1 hypothetical protein [Bacillus thuringiensis]
MKKEFDIKGKRVRNIISKNEGVALCGVPPAFRKKTTLRKSELKNQKIYHYSKTHTGVPPAF